MFDQGTFNGWMGQKYGAIGQQANAATTAAQAAVTRADADAGLMGAQAAAVPGTAAAQIAEARARAGLYGAESRLTDMKSQPFSNGFADFLHGNYDRNLITTPTIQGHAAGTANVQPQHAPASPEMLGEHWDQVNGYAGGTANVPAQAAAPQHYDKGTKRVPGKGSGMVDKVPAMLAPGEAVLNKGAAEHFGRDKIAALNAIGHAKMVGEAAQVPAAAKPGQEQPQRGPAHKAPEKPAGGGPGKPGAKAPAKDAKPASGHGAKPAPAGKGKPQELSKGTHHVQSGKSAKTPQIDPQALQALMGMMSQGGGGGGMPGMGGPAGGGGPPMPPSRGGMV
jgi:hypothetical protein